MSDAVTPWIVARQAPLPREFSRQEYWSGLPFPPLGDLPNPGIKPASPVFPVLADRFFTTEPTGKPQRNTKRIMLKGLRAQLNGALIEVEN